MSDICSTLVKWYTLNTPKPLYNTVVWFQSRNPVKQWYYIQTKMYRLYRKMTIFGHFST